MTKLRRRTMVGAAGGMLIALSAAAPSVWPPLGYLAGPGCLGVGYFYWRLSGIVRGAGLTIVRVAWVALGILVLVTQAGVGGFALSIGAAAVAVGVGNLAVALQPSVYPLPVWIGSLISLVVPLLAVTVSLFYVVGAPTVADVASNSGIGFTVAVTGIFAAHGIGSAIAAFGTDRIVPAEPTHRSV